MTYDDFSGILTKGGTCLLYTSTVLRGKLAEQQSIFIMRTFREMRHYIRQNQQFVTRNEMDPSSSVSSW